MGSMSMKGWIEAIGAALVAFALSFLSIQIGNFSLVLAIIPLVFISLRRGMLQGFGAGVIAGLLVFFFNTEASELLVELMSGFAPLAFIGLSGFFAKFTQRTLNNKRFPNAALNIVTASLLGSLLYFIWIFVSAEAMTIQVAGISFLLTFAVAAVVLVLLAKLAPSSYIPKDTPFLSRKEKSRLLND